MKLKSGFLLLLFFCIISCNNGTQKTPENTPSIVFKSFLKKFIMLDLPLTIKPFEINTNALIELNSDELNIVDRADIDPGLDHIYAYGILPDTTKTYKLICLYPTEIHLPVLLTFNKNGKKIAEESLSVGGCGSDCGFTCTETIQIFKDQRIYSSDSIEGYDCDSLGIIKNTRKKYVRYKRGFVDNDGKINLSEVTEAKQQLVKEK